MSLNSTLDARDSRYGSFEGQAKVSQALKSVMESTSMWVTLEPHQKEALEMIQHKIARALNGDPNYSDNWHDIAGYATLVDKILTQEKEA